MLGESPCKSYLILCEMNRSSRLTITVAVARRLLQIGRKIYYISTSTFYNILFINYKICACVCVFVSLHIAQVLSFNI